jgi:hypothetical protein
MILSWDDWDELFDPEDLVDDDWDETDPPIYVLEGEDEDGEL